MKMKDRQTHLIRQLSVIDGHGRESSKRSTSQISQIPSLLVICARPSHGWAHHSVHREGTYPLSFRKASGVQVRQSGDIIKPNSWKKSTTSGIKHCWTMLNLLVFEDWSKPFSSGKLEAFKTHVPRGRTCRKRRLHTFVATSSGLNQGQKVQLVIFKD